jgi:hypothetical protein
MRIDAASRKKTTFWAAGFSPHTLRFTAAKSRQTKVVPCSDKGRSYRVGPAIELRVGLLIALAVSLIVLAFRG